MLTDQQLEAMEVTSWGNLPTLQEAGFFGRSRELWLIERAFVGNTRRLTISGFGGQGKTYLAVEAGLWLQRTGMFKRVCFVDYAAFQVGLFHSCKIERNRELGEWGNGEIGKNMMIQFFFNNHLSALLVMTTINPKI